MATVALSTEMSQSKVLDSSQQPKGYSMAREFSPLSKNGGQAAYQCCSSCAFGIMLLLGIILWSVGAGQMNPGMITAGQVLFGIGILPCACAILCCPCLTCALATGGTAALAAVASGNL